MREKLKQKIIAFLFMLGVGMLLTGGALVLIYGVGLLLTSVYHLFIGG